MGYQYSGEISTISSNTPKFKVKTKNQNPGSKSRKRSPVQKFMPLIIIENIIPENTHCTKLTYQDNPPISLKLTLKKMIQSQFKKTKFRT
jgi:hypothetical protein